MPNAAQRSSFALVGSREFVWRAAARDRRYDPLPTHDDPPPANLFPAPIPSGSAPVDGNVAAHVVQPGRREEVNSLERTRQRSMAIGGVEHLSAEIKRLSSAIERLQNQVGELRKQLDLQNDVLQGRQSKERLRTRQLGRRSLEKHVKGVASGRISRVPITFPDDTIFGAAVVLPQVARNLFWEPRVLGQTIKAWLLMAFALCIQSAFVHHIWKIHWELSQKCNNDPEECMSEGYARSTFNYDRFAGYWYLCRAPEVNMLRLLCIFVFTIQMFGDMRQTWEIGSALFRLPSKDGDWVDFDEEGHMKWKVDGVPMGWKICYAVGIILPKAAVWLGLYTVASVWLLNTKGRSELVLNCVALLFVLELDEHIMTGVMTQSAQDHLKRMDEYLLDEHPEPALQSTDSDYEVDDFVTGTFLGRMLWWGRHLGFRSVAYKLITEVSLLPAFLVITFVVDIAIVSRLSVQDCLSGQHEFE